MMNDFEPACAGHNRLPRNGVFLQRRYKLEGYRALQPGELDAMAPYADEVRTQLKKSAL